MRSPRPSILFALALALVASGGGGGSHVGAASSGPQQVAVPPMPEPVGPYSGFTYVGRPQARGDAPLARTSTFQVTYNGFTPDAQAAFQYAVDIWGFIVQSPVPIRVTANFRSDFPPYVLGSAGTTMMVRDFPRAPRANTYYPAALANARAGVDLVSGEEIVANFNANFDWYLGLDGNARTQFDFVTVVLHELGHGLGFYGSLRVENGVGAWGFGAPAYPVVYDAFMTNVKGEHLVDPNAFPPGSALLANALVTGDVHFAGPTARNVDHGSPSIFAPNPWVPGSSLAHLSDDLYPSGDINSLMTPAVSPGEVIHHPGPLTTSILNDMGWPIVQVISSTPRPVGGVRVSIR